MKELDIYDWTPLPSKRIFIPKPDGRKRPIGIPTIIDRVIQNMVKNALEPEWETRFEPYSTGFRPGRSYNDAIGRIQRALSPKSRPWVFEADFSLCFESINQEFLMNKIKGFPASKLIKKYLEAGILYEKVWFNTDVGTPQGGVLSPLLCNIALHGMGQELGIKLDKGGKVITGTEYIMVRFADDFVIFCKTKQSALNLYEKLESIIKPRGFTLMKLSGQSHDQPLVPEPYVRITTHTALQYVCNK